MSRGFVESVAASTVVAVCRTWGDRQRSSRRACRMALMPPSWLRLSARGARGCGVNGGGMGGAVRADHLGEQE
eukprot:4949552-Pleurochrysis_carterae.AAC.1